MAKLITVVAVLAVAACGSSDKGKQDAAMADAPRDGRSIDAPRDAPQSDGPPGTTPLKVKNYDSWCNVSVNGGVASSASVQTVNVTPGTINLSAVALTGFELGATPWHDTTGDTGAGDPGIRTGSGQTMAAAATVVVGSTAKCAWVCCESQGLNDCPTADQCP